MSKKSFIIVTQDATGAQQQAIHKAFPHFAWWHHMPQLWVMIDGTGLFTVASIRDVIMRECPGMTHYVFEAIPGTWAGSAPPIWHEWFTQQFTP